MSTTSLGALPEVLKVIKARLLFATWLVGPKLLASSALFLLPMVALAQQSIRPQQGDYYDYAPPNPTVVNPTTQDLKQSKEDDYYTPTPPTFKITKQRYSAIENCSKRSLAQYPDNSIEKIRNRDMIYGECMAEFGEQP
jgi:hypothetical protein